MSCSSWKKKEGIFCIILSEGKFFHICVLAQCRVYWIHFQNIHTFTYQKTLLHALLLLLLKIVECLRCILHKYGNKYHNTTKMKPVDVKSSIYIDFDKENNDKDPKFNVGDHERISKYKNIFAKGYVPNWSDEVFLI